MMLGHMGETVMETSAVHDILRFRYQRMTVTILYLKRHSVYTKYEYENVTSLHSYFLKVLNVGAWPDLN